MSIPRTVALFCAPLLIASLASAQILPDRAALGGSVSSTILEDFEAYPVGGGGAENLGVLSLDEATIANGYGPNLVLDGCTYSCASNSLQWDGAGYYGSASKNLLGNTSDGVLTLTYDSPVTAVGFDMLAFSGFADSTIVTVYNGSGGVIFTSSPISVPSAAPVFFGYTAASIGKVTIDSQVYSWSTLIDDHEFGSAGPTVAKNGTCPGAMTVVATNCTPSGQVAFVYGNAGSWTKPSGTCAGVTLAISSPTLATVKIADGSGSASVSFTAPPGICGKTVQVVDVSTCTPSNAITL